MEGTVQERRTLDGEIEIGVTWAGEEREWRRTDDLRPPAPEAPREWWRGLKEGDIVQMQRKKVWWPMRVRGWRGDRIRLWSDVHGPGGEAEQLKAGGKLRPNWRWLPGENKHSFLVGGRVQEVHALTLQAGGRARVVGDSWAARGAERRLLGEADDRKWRVSGRKPGEEVLMQATDLQPVQGPKPDRAANAEGAARKATKRWLQATGEELDAIARSLQAHAEELRVALQPREQQSVHAAAWRAARRNFADVAELREALGLLFAPNGRQRMVRDEQLTELAYLLAGTGGDTGKRWATWRETGRPPWPF